MVCVPYASYSHAGSSCSEDRNQSLRTDSGSVMDLAVGLISLLQTIFGVLGNFSLLYHYLFLYFTGCRLRPTDLIVNSLIVANSLVLFSSGISFTKISFGSYDHLSGFGCRFISYLCGVGRGVSIGTICLLNVFQAITISPMNSRWAGLKRKAPKYIVASVFLYWILQMLVNVIFPMHMSSTLSNENFRNRKKLGFCSYIYLNETMNTLYAVLIASPDFVCFVLMLWASGSMVFILCRHKLRIQHIHRTPVSSQSSPESRATKTILLLASTFVFLNTSSFIFHIVFAILSNPSLLLYNIYVLITLSFPTVSPFLIMSHDPSVSRLSFAWIKNAKFPTFMRNM
ncbi:vomeronasal type-1 receptor 4-like [Phyllostomus discolor]|uniref:Vomeronasal type-1 receptor n=1 Tax=Phyllostomus discolor TaxID=89673 RepID=A0A6J2N6N3_9CHIR|nr:vomeronasal type-1 receptor 4-like [Phyllostomus discolor]